MHIQSQRPGLWKLIAACYRKLKCQQIVSAIPPSSAVNHTKLEGKMIPY